MPDDKELEELEANFHFSPEKGNVAFSSAYDCWAFTLPDIARRIGPKHGMNPNALVKFLWGEYYYSNKKVSKDPTKDD